MRKLSKRPAMLAGLAPVHHQILEPEFRAYVAKLTAQQRLDLVPILARWQGQLQAYNILLTIGGN